MYKRQGEDSDGRIYLVKELYQSQQTVNQLAPQITAMSASHTVTATIADHDAEDRATLGEHGIKTLPADKRVKTGLDAVAERLKVAGDGKPRLYIVRDATTGQDTRLGEMRRPVSTEQEFPGYVWSATNAGRAAAALPLDLVHREAYLAKGDPDSWRLGLAVFRRALENRGDE